MPTPLHLWIDDERDPIRFRNPFYRDIPWVWARTASEALEILRQGQVEVVSFDNDLGPGEMEGHQIFDNLEQWIEEGFVARIPSIHVHTANPIARRRMRLGVQRLYARQSSLAPKPFSRNTGSSRPPLLLKSPGRIPVSRVFSSRAPTRNNSSSPWAGNPSS
jgi:hypothetical protein